MMDFVFAFFRFLFFVVVYFVVQLTVIWAHGGASMYANVHIRNRFLYMWLFFCFMLFLYKLGASMYTNVHIRNRFLYMWLFFVSCCFYIN